MSWAAKSVPISRYIAIRTCVNMYTCVGGFEAKPESLRSKLDLYPGRGGMSGVDRAEVDAGGTPINSKILVTESTDGTVSIIADLRSGTDSKRFGITKTVTVRSLGSFSPITLTDRPIFTSGHYVQAQLVIEPAN